MIGLAPISDILDLPAGTGRHSEFFSGLGHLVTAADIDEVLVLETAARVRENGGNCVGMVMNACHDLPFERSCFDLAVVVDFVDEHLLATIGEFVRIGGHLIYESYIARGGNWRQLLPPGQTEELLAPMFETVLVNKSVVGPNGTQAETIKLVATRR